MCVCVCVTLMTGTLGLNREDSWFRTSARSCWCFRTFLIFMILTMAAYTQTHTHNQHYFLLNERHSRHSENTWMRSFLSSSMFLWVVSCSCFCSVFIGTLMFTLSFLLRWTKQTNKVNTKSSIIQSSVVHHFCSCAANTRDRTSFSLLVSEEQLDDGVGFEIHLVHVGVLVLHDLTDGQRRSWCERTQWLFLSRYAARVWGVWWLYLTPPAVQNENNTKSERLPVFSQALKMSHFVSVTMKLTLLKDILQLNILKIITDVLWDLMDENMVAFAENNEIFTEYLYKWKGYY